MKLKPAARLARAEPIKTRWRTTIRPTGAHRLRPAATAPRAPAVRRALARAPDQQEWVAGRISGAAPIRLIDRRWRRRSCAAAQPCSGDALYTWRPGAPSRPDRLSPARRGCDLSVSQRGAQPSGSRCANLTPSGWSAKAAARVSHQRPPQRQGLQRQGPRRSRCGSGQCTAARPFGRPASDRTAVWRRLRPGRHRAARAP